MKKILPVALAIIIALALFSLQEYYLSQPAEKGITIDRQHRIHFSSHEDSLEYLQLTLSPDISLIQRSMIHDSMLSNDKIPIVDEVIFRARALHPNSIDDIDLQITARFFDNADMLIFIRCFSTLEMESSISLDFHFPLRHFEETRFRSLNYESLLKPTEMSSVVSSMDLSPLYQQSLVYPSTLHYMEWISKYNTVNGSLILGPGAVFKNKEVRLRELKSSEIRPVMELNQKEAWLKVSIPVQLMENQYQENWLMYSFRQLLNYTEAETMKNMLSADFNIRKKLSMDGIYHIAASQFYVGASDDTYDYYYNYAMWEGQRFMNLHRNFPQQRFFYNFFVNAVYTTVKSVNRYGVWISDVRSQYLWNTYGIPEGFIDTRYCTDAGFFLLRAYNEFQIPDAISAGEKFGDFLYQKMMEKEGIVIGEQGFFFYDYYYNSQRFVTHASLNHILSELNYLFELYLSTYKSNYLAAAETILAGIHETGRSWIRDQEWGKFRYDLWYAVFPEAGNGLRYDLHDYTQTLTYNDLLKTQRLLQVIYNRTDSLIEEMIQTKIRFFQRQSISY